MVTMFSRIVRIPTRSGLESGTACTRVKEFPEVSVFLFSKPKETGMMPGSVCSVTMIAKKSGPLDGPSQEKIPTLVPDIARSRTQRNL